MKKHGSPFKRRSQGIVKSGFCGCTVRKGIEAERLLRRYPVNRRGNFIPHVRKGTEAERLLRPVKANECRSYDELRRVRKGTEAERLLRLPHLLRIFP